VGDCDFNECKEVASLITPVSLWDRVHLSNEAENALCSESPQLCRTLWARSKATAVYALYCRCPEAWGR
jgi:hypothetical protein